MISFPGRKFNAKVKNLVEQVFKVHLLQEEGVRTLYQQKLTQYVEQMATVDNIEGEWFSIRKCIKQAAGEALGKRRKVFRRNGFGI